MAQGLLVPDLMRGSAPARTLGVVVTCRALRLGHLGLLTTLGTVLVEPAMQNCVGANSVHYRVRRPIQSKPRAWAWVIVTRMVTRCCRAIAGARSAARSGPS